MSGKFYQWAAASAVNPTNVAFSCQQAGGFQGSIYTFGVRPLSTRPSAFKEQQQGCKRLRLLCIFGVYASVGWEPDKALGSGRSVKYIYFAFMEDAGPGLFSPEGLFTGSTLSNKSNLKRITVKVCM